MERYAPYERQSPEKEKNCGSGLQNAAEENCRRFSRAAARKNIADHEKIKIIKGAAAYAATALFLISNYYAR